MNKKLIISGILQIVFALIFYIDANYHPTPSCVQYNDCTGAGMTMVFMVYPFAFFGLLNLILAFVNKAQRYQHILLGLSWAYVLYWLLPYLIGIAAKG